MSDELPEDLDAWMAELKPSGRHARIDEVTWFATTLGSAVTELAQAMNALRDRDFDRYNERTKKVAGEIDLVIQGIKRLRADGS